MDELIKKVKYFDSLTNQYVEIPVSIELETFIKRSYWREEKQNKRYYARISDIETLYLDDSTIYNNRYEAVDKLIKEFEKLRLIESIEKLEERDRQLIRLIYYKNLTLTNAAKELGVSVSYISRLLKRVYAKLKENLKDIQEIN